MTEMNSETDLLWSGIQPLLLAFAERITAGDPTLKYEISNSSNEAFLLRAYAALRRSGDGEEIAICVDVKAENDLLAVMSDISTDSGEIIEEGPSAMLQLSGPFSTSEDLLRGWINRFDEFLVRVEPTVRMLVSGIAVPKSRDGGS